MHLCVDFHVEYLIFFLLTQNRFYTKMPLKINGLQEMLRGDNFVLWMNYLEFRVETFLSKTIIIPLRKNYYIILCWILSTDS